MKSFNYKHPTVREVTISLKEYRDLIMKDAMIELMTCKIDDLQAEIVDLQRRLNAKGKEVS